MADEERSERVDTTVPGGRYIVNGQVVDAHGQVIEGYKVGAKGELTQVKKAPPDPPEGDK